MPPPALAVLQVIGWLAPRYGGPPVAVIEARPWLIERGHTVDIVTTTADGPDTLQVETGRPVEWGGTHATFHRLAFPKKFLTSWSLLSYLRHRVAHYDVIHIHGLYRFHTIAASLIARRRGVPYILQAHGALNPWPRRRRRRLAKNIYHRLIEDRLIEGAAVLLCTSEEEERSIRDLGYSVATAVIPIGIDIEALREPADPADLLRRAGAGPDDLIVTFLGRISEIKGLELIVESFRSTAHSFPTARLIVAGPDDEGIAKRLAPVISAAGLSDRVSFVGSVFGSEKRALLQHSDVFLLPSGDESFGIAVAEAMAVGCPVVISPNVAIQHLVRSAGAGIVAQRDPADIAQAVATILSDRVAAAAMGEAGRRVVEQRFSWREVAAQLDFLYRSVTRASRSP